MKHCLVADDGQARVVIGESNELDEIRNYAGYCSIEMPDLLVPCKFHICRREPSANGENLVTIETWEKGVKL